MLTASRQQALCTFWHCTMPHCHAGHRSTRPHSLPLRRGMLHYAYSRQLPVQIVVTDGKEAVISEKHMSAHFGQTLLVGYSNVIRSTVRAPVIVCMYLAERMPCW
jgi:hypothetical protein